jgi:putative transposase
MTVDDREAWALFRSRLISPLVDPACSRAERTASRAYLQAHPPRDPHGQPWVPPVRTLERCQQAYRTGGFDALRPPRRADCGARRTIPTACWEQVCRLQREVPERSTAQMLALLTPWPLTVGIDPTVIARILPSTLYRHGQQAGITRRQLRVAAPKRYRRWEAPGPGALWQSDVMAGPWLPDPQPRDPGHTRQTACWVLMADDSRRLVAGRWAWQADSALLEAVLAEALLRYGAPERLDPDNGSLDNSDRFTQICARLNIRLVHTPPYTPAGKGKQERLWGLIQASFLPV